MLGKESVKRQEEIWDIVRQQVRNNYSTDTGGDNDDTATNQSVKMDNECICMTAKKP